jgi:uncharacterized protein (TIGR03435 family)
MIRVAYGIKDDHIRGGPSWLDRDAFDFEGKAAGPSTAPQFHEMLKTLLKDEFKLQVHIETRNGPVYELRVDPDRKDLKLSPSSEPQAKGWIGVTQDEHPGQMLHNTWTGTAASMEFLALRLNEVMDRPVVDRTGLQGPFDFRFSFTRALPLNIPDGALFNGVPLDTSGPTVFEGIRKLGLKLVAATEPVETLIVDYAEKPSN